MGLEADVQLSGGGFALRRGVEGVVEVRAESEAGLAAGLGWAHAHDRLVQMELQRVAGQGRLCELLADDEETLEIDCFMRDLELARGAEEDAEGLDPATMRIAEAYAEGVNAWLERHRRPIELLLVRHRPAPWRVADTLLTVGLMSYVGLVLFRKRGE